jgi:hypothetical protein
MTQDLKARGDEELAAQWHDLYRQVQEPGCAREVVRAYEAIDDELTRRGYFAATAEPPACALEGDDEDVETWDQPPGPEWGA